jgi:poly(A) polymerase
MMNVTQKPHLHQDWIDPHALGIVRALQKKGFKTYLVGGCVRDLLLGIHPKDFDIATDAKPDEVRSTIHRSYIIGKRFRLVLVRREEMQFEVATFRRDVREDEKEDNLLEGDNAFGTCEEDARRRDFTINGLFYDPVADQLIDFAEGLPDLEHRWVRMIGDPMKRLVEDPIRIMRALRLKHMIGFALDPDLRRAMQEQANTLPSTVLPRRREEILKWLRLKSPDLAFHEAHDLGILKYISPTLDQALNGPGEEDFYAILRQIPHHEALSPAELFGLLVLAFVRAFLQPEPGEGPRARDLLQDEKMQAWMRDELGMFKFEQALVVKALHVEPLLAKRKEFQRKGERRQKALLSNEAFPLALRFASQDYFLGGEDMLYWRERYQLLREENPVSNNSTARRRRRRPRRRTNGGGNSKEATS